VGGDAPAPESNVAEGESEERASRLAGESEYLAGETDLNQED
jgi:hypothetical protein